MLKYVMNKRRQTAQKIKKELSSDFIKDAVITQIQPMFGQEVIDIDIGFPETIIYLRKGGKSKTEKD